LFHKEGTGNWGETVKLESTARKIGGSRYILVPSDMADFFFGEANKTQEDVKVTIEDSVDGKTKTLVVR